jgi:hypothetical protein
VNCYNTGDVFSSSDSGGIIGCVNVHVSGTATITSNVAISAEINGRWRGRIVGYLSGSNITVSNNFALDSMTAIGGSFDTTPANHGISKTEPQLKTRSTYEDPVTGDGLGGLGWQFGNDADHPWKMPEGGGYPILYWQTEP